MSLWVIGDLHLSFGVEKPMDIFAGWEHHGERLYEAWHRCIQPEDTVVLAGDTSWGMTLEEALPDFEWIQALPGKQKILLKGNHDYWWSTMAKMQRFFEAHQLDTLHLLHNNHYQYGEYGICGTCGWVNMDINPAPDDAKVIAREAQRLDVSLKSAEQAGLKPLAFLHYPPIYAANCNYGILEVLWRHPVRDCWYGHIHGRHLHKYAINGERDGICYHLIASDYVQFIPQKVM